MKSTVSNWQTVPHVIDVRLVLDTRMVAITLAVPIELLEDAQNEEGAVAIVAKLITMVPYLRDHVLEYKKLMEALRPLWVQKP